MISGVAGGIAGSVADEAIAAVKGHSRQFGPGAGFARICSP